MVAVHLALGANLGDRQRTLRRAVDTLAERLTLVAVSSVYETTPFGVSDQPEFLNCCVGGETSLSPRELLAATREAERALGRTAGRRWGPREIDIDILLYGEERIDEADLVVPHPGLLERAFVLVPLAEIAPDATIAPSGITVAAALSRVARSPADVRLVAPPPAPRAAR